uniref:LITAF domain-containing protein n=1 Tax=Parascaris univalens TaxID=6257 RepID=A0A914ZU74_PARUN
MCCLLLLLKPSSLEICPVCGQQTLEKRFTHVGIMCGIGASLFCGLGIYLMLLLRENFCQNCYLNDFNRIAKIRRRLQCHIDDKSEREHVNMEEKSIALSEASDIPKTEEAKKKE